MSSAPAHALLTATKLDVVQGPGLAQVFSADAAEGGVAGVDFCP